MRPELTVAFTNRSRKSGFVTRGGVRRRETLWIDDPVVESTLAGAPTATLISSGSAALLALRPFTVVRVRGILHCGSDSVANSERWGVAMGMCVVSDQAVAIGVTAVPTPITDQSSDLWFVYEMLFGRILIGSGAGTGVPTGAGSLFKDYDSKAMRKVEEGQDLITVVENSINGVIVVHSARILLKLH